MLSVRGLTVEIGGTLLIEGAGFTVRAGDRVGLVGRNGAGKTSLLKVLGGMSEPKAGVIQRPAAFGYLPQEPRLDSIPPETTALTHVLSGRGLDELAARMEELRLKMEAQPGDERLVAKWSRAHDAFEHADGYAAESEARRLLAGLGLRSDRAERPITVLSGGERRRVELARILFAGSELLMLDEPTNHLDNDAREWLLDFLRAYRGALGPDEWAPGLEARAVRHSLGCLLARVAGRSPLEYLDDEERRRQRTAVVALMRETPTSLRELVDAWRSSLRGIGADH